MTYYQIIQVSPDASFDSIKQSYRKLAMVYHPDKNNGSKESEEQFKELSEAYYVLSDPSRRLAYDSQGSSFMVNGFDLQKMEQEFTEFLRSDVGVEVTGELLMLLFGIKDRRYFKKWYRTFSKKVF